MVENNYPKNITDLHIELTDKCQASCPMCARNYSGGAERPFVGQHDITLEQFKSWFPSEFLKGIKNFYACGNYGDPIISKECLEIFEYVRSCTDGRLSIHTNGSARSTNWWTNLAEVLSGLHEVVFGIDGFAESHALYRRGTDWQKIIDNARAFITAGGMASVDCLVFKHNQHEIEDFKKEMLSIGFKSVNVKSTGRFYDMQKFPVLNTVGRVEYYLEPAALDEYKTINFLKLDELSKDITLWQDIVNRTEVVPKCVSKKEIYVDARGTVYPCCWVGCDMVEELLDVTMPIHDLRNKMVKNTNLHFGVFSRLNLNLMHIDEILNSSSWNVVYESATPPWTCVKNCKL
jgi:MoaA/NifB/PqqE/SkfB family radical SAM enzyme